MNECAQSQQKAMGQARQGKYTNRTMEMNKERRMTSIVEDKRKREMLKGMMKRMV